MLPVPEKKIVKKKATKKVVKKTEKKVEPSPKLSAAQKAIVKKQLARNEYYEALEKDFNELAKKHKFKGVLAFSSDKHNALGTLGTPSLKDYEKAGIVQLTLR